MKKPTIVEIEWVDSCSVGGWHRPEHFTEASIANCRTVGYILERTSRHIVVVQNYGDDTRNVGEGMAIPAKAIKRVRRLK